MTASIAIGNTVTLDRALRDFAGTEHPAGSQLLVEKVAHETTRHPIVMATPTDWTRHAVTHQSMHPIQIGGDYCFYLDDLREATEGIPF